MKEKYSRVTVDQPSSNRVCETSAHSEGHFRAGQDHCIHTAGYLKRHMALIKREETWQEYKQLGSHCFSFFCLQIKLNVKVRWFVHLIWYSIYRPRSLCCELRRFGETGFEKTKQQLKWCHAVSPNKRGKIYWSKRSLCCGWAVIILCMLPLAEATFLEHWTLPQCSIFHYEHFAFGIFQVTEGNNKNGT